MILFFLFFTFLFPTDSKSELIQFENRSACAIDSKEPTRFAYLIVDSYNAGKIIDSMGQSENITDRITAEEGMKALRLAISEVWMTLMQEILAGRLPFLNDESFQSVILSCNNEFPCVKMDQFLSNVFHDWKKDNKSEENLDLPFSSCKYLKQFSALQSNLNQDRPDQELLQKIALDQIAKNKFYADCLDTSPDLSSRRFILEFGVHGYSLRQWKRIGFDYWQSLKIYFSFAWRHPDLLLNKTTALNHIFKNLAIEQMIHLVSAECRSIEKPECTRSQISFDIFRSLAKSAEETEVDRLIPDFPEQKLLQYDIPNDRSSGSVFPEHLEVEKWLSEFQQKIIRRRGLLKQKLLQSIHQFEILMTSATVDQLANGLEALKQQMPRDPLLARKLKTLCSEIDISTRPGFNLLQEKFQTIPSSLKFMSMMESIAVSINDLRISEIQQYHRSVSEMTFQFCEKINKDHSWSPKIKNDLSDESSWFLELTGKRLQQKADQNGMGALFNVNPPNQQPYLSLDSFNSNGVKITKPFCVDASDCIRLSLKSMIDLYSVSAWSDAFIPVQDWIQSPNLSNPWAYATACKTYDPWSATKKAIIGLFTDLAMTLTTGSIPAPVYLSVQTKPREVTHFNLEHQGDDLFLKPIKSGKSADVTFGADLGSLVGVPCSLVITPTSIHPSIGGYYTVSSIVAQTCTSMNNSRLIVGESSPWGDHQNKSFSACGLCYLNPYSVLSGISSIATSSIPLLKIAVGTLFTGISFAKRLSDKIDIPHRYDVDPDLVVDTYQKFGFIPKRCVRRLSKGHSCRHVFLTKNEKENKEP